MDGSFSNIGLTELILRTRSSKHIEAGRIPSNEERFGIAYCVKCGRWGAIEDTELQHIVINDMKVETGDRVCHPCLEIMGEVAGMLDE